MVSHVLSYLYIRKIYLHVHMYVPTYPRLPPPSILKSMTRGEGQKMKNNNSYLCACAPHPPANNTATPPPPTTTTTSITTHRQTLLVTRCPGESARRREDHGDGDGILCCVLRDQQGRSVV